MTAPLPDLLTIEQLSTILHKATKTLRNWRSKKPPRGPKWVNLGGRTVMYRREDVEEYLKNGGDR